MPRTAESASTDDVFVARQPIFTSSQQVYGYELLFRSGLVNAFDDRDARQASLSVIDTSIFVLGLQRLTAGRRAFINFPRDLLLDGYATLLPPELVVIELLESIEPDDAVVAACQRLRRAGYTLALDDFVWQQGMGRLTDLVQIVKVDVLATDLEERQRLAQSLRRPGLQLLAEKVETEARLTETGAAGYNLFQGYFLSRPTIISGRALPQSKLTTLRLLQELQRPDTDFDALAQLVGQDVTLSYKLLRYVNSAAFGQRQPVTSLQRAMLLLGLRGARQWATIVALAAATGDRPAELITTSAWRAKFCEGIGIALGQPDAAEDLFLIGLFSLLDALLQRPLAEILAELATTDAVRRTLLGEPGPLSTVYNLTLAYEQAAWAEVTALCQQLSLPEAQLPLLYTRAVEWAHQTTGETGDARA